MKHKEVRLILIIVLVILGLWLAIRFLSMIPFWAWILAVGIIVYLNWGKIKRELSDL